MSARKLYVVRWYEDEGLHVKHIKVFGDEQEAQDCVKDLQSGGKVFNVTLKTERSRP